MSKHTISLTVDCSAPINEVWLKVTDWNSQGDWMLQTKVWSTDEDGVTISAFTGPLYRFYPRLAFLGVLDIMKVSSWNTPYSCDVVHIGKVIRGTGTFRLESNQTGSTTFHWSETIEAPALLFALIRPFFIAGVLISLKRFSRTFIESPKARG